MKYLTRVLAIVVLVVLAGTDAHSQRIKIPKSTIRFSNPKGILGPSQNTVRLEAPRRVTTSAQMRRVIDHATVKNSATLPGLKGNSIFRNDGRHGSGMITELNFSGQPTVYKKYDINPRIGGGRDAERLIINQNTGTIFHTTDHYKSFRQVSN